jgi:hypothetical protein
VAHEIFGPRFYSKRKLAWHRLGYVSDEPLSATAALKLAGEYSVELEPLSTPSGIRVPQRAIVRAPTWDDRRPRCFGVVGPDYELITPQACASIWDEQIMEPVETLGSMREGRCLFVSARLPSFEVFDDQVDNYLILAHWMEPDVASQVFLAPVRVVCMNTMRLADSMATHRLRVVHSHGAAIELAAQLKAAVATAEGRSAAIKEAFASLAAHRVEGSGLSHVLFRAYPEPAKPTADARPEVMTARSQRYVEELDAVKHRRAAVIELFDGAGRGMEHPAAAGTYWGLYQAIVETENFRPSSSDAQAATSVLIGARSEVMRRAFASALELCQAAA